MSAPMRFAMLQPLLVSLALLPARAMAQEGVPAGEGLAPTLNESPTPPAPEGTPPPPPPEEGAPPYSPDTEATDGATDGQWVYTDAEGWIWVPAGAVASDVDSEPYVFLYTPSIGWSWFLSPWGEGPFFVGSWVHAPHRHDGGYPHYGGNPNDGRYDGHYGPRAGAPGHTAPRYVGPRHVTPGAGPRPIAPGAVGPRYVAPRPMAPSHLGPQQYVAPRPVAPSNAAPRYTAPPPMAPAPRYVAPPVYHAAPAMAPQPAFGGHMAAPVGGGGPHR